MVGDICRSNVYYIFILELIERGNNETFDLGLHFVKNKCQFSVS